MRCEDNGHFSVQLLNNTPKLAARAYISVATAKKHNTNINRKLGVTSREELMLYIDLFRRCGRLDEIAAPRAEDTARCTT